MAPFRSRGHSYEVTIALTHAFIWIIGLVGIGVGSARIERQFSERERAEESLRNSQAFLHTLVQTIPDLMWLKDSDGVYLSCNPIFERFYGAREADIMGKTDYDFVDRELADFFRENDGKAMAAGRPTRNEEWVTFADDGQRVLLETIKTPMVDSRGALIGVLGIGRDITERKRAEEELLASEARYKAVAHSANDAIVSIDVAGNIVGWNPGAEKIFGYSEPEVRGRSALLLMPSRFHEGHLAGMTRILAGGEQHVIGRTVELEGRRKDGGEFPLEMSLSEWQVSTDRYYTAIIRDTTQRKQAEEILRQSEQRYRSILVNMEEGYYEVDLEGTLTFANDAFYKILGRTKEEMLGKNYREVMRPEKADQTHLAFNEVFRTGEPARAIDWEMIRKDGSPRAIEASVIPLRVSKRRYSGFSGVIRDVTERKRAEEDLRASQARYRTLVENVGEGITVLDPEETIVFSNPATDRLFGVAPGALVGRNLREFMTPERFALAGDQIRQRQLGKTSVYEEEIVLPDGVLRHLLVTAVPQYDGEHKVSGTLAILHDITARKEAEERLRLAGLEREKAKGNILLAQLIQGLAHEVRNPLFAINTNIAVLEKKTKIVPGVTESMAFVKEHTGRLDSLMRDLLNLGRRLNVGDFVDCSLRDLVEAAVLAVEGRIPEVSGRVVLEAPEEPFTVSTIPDRLQLALVHLIENALQNSPAGSRVTVRVNQSRSQAFVAVMDEGAGIPGKIRARLFEPFVTTHTSRRGLGLALVKHYVESMGGTIEAADNVPGPGTTFTATLPVGG